MPPGGFLNARYVSAIILSPVHRPWFARMLTLVSDAMLVAAAEMVRLRNEPVADVISSMRYDYYCHAIC
jgi:hypothetical protein